jgi:hypothetical protein
MFISDLSHFQSVEKSSVVGGSYKKYYYDVYVKVKQYADGGKAYAESYKGDAIADASASNYSKVVIDF